MFSGKRVDETDEAFGEEWTKEFIYYVYLGKRKIELNVFLIYIYLLNTIIFYGGYHVIRLEILEGTLVFNWKTIELYTLRNKLERKCS